MNTQPHGFDELKLAKYLQANIAGFKVPVAAEKFACGQSNPTFLLIAASGKYVLRRKPGGQLLKSAHAVDWEFKVLQARNTPRCLLLLPIICARTTALLAACFM